VPPWTGPSFGSDLHGKDGFPFCFGRYFFPVYGGEIEVVTIQRRYSLNGAVNGPGWLATYGDLGKRRSLQNTWAGGSGNTHCRFQRAKDLKFNSLPFH
jgi:hypothetical protein